MDKTELGGMLKKIADDAWKASQEPVLLSDLPAELRLHDASLDYKEVLKPQSMKAFIKEGGAQFGIQLVAHPEQRAKLGLIPAGVAYTFPPTGGTSAVQDEKSSVGSAEGVALMRMLAKLSDDDLSKITIPVSVLAKLFR